MADLDGDGDTTERTPFDRDGDPRFMDDPVTEDTGVPDLPDYPQIVDMGAYEYQFCFGDLNGDDVVDLADLAQLLGSCGETSGMTYFDGDLDGDGDVDLADLAVLLGVYGDVCQRRGVQGSGFSMVSGLRTRPTGRCGPSCGRRGLSRGCV